MRSARMVGRENTAQQKAEWVTKDQVVIELNTGFSPQGLSAQEVTVVVAAWQNGALSRDSMLDVFRRGEVLPEGRSNEEKMRLVGKDGPPQQAQGAGQVLAGIAGGQV